MKVLITGGAGYVGTSLTSQLLAQGVEVRCLDTLRFGVEPILGFFKHQNYEFILGDVRDRFVLANALKDVDAIVHLAAIVGYPACRNMPDLSRGTNVEGTRLLMSLRSKDQPLIMASTGSIYGAVPSGLCDENTPPGPLSLYAETKVEAEEIVRSYEDTVVYRFATAFGLSPRLRLDLLVNDLCFQAITNSSIVMYESHFQRTFIHVDDMGRAFIHALSHFDEMRNEVFNCGDRTMNTTKLEIARMIQSHHDYYLHLADVGSDLDARDYEMSFDKIRATGFTTQVTLEAGIAEMARAFRYLSPMRAYSNVELAA